MIFPLGCVSITALSMTKIGSMVIIQYSILVVIMGWGMGVVGRGVAMIRFCHDCGNEGSDS